jgi:hypothetical protein
MGANASNAGVSALSKAAASALRAQMTALLAHLGVSDGVSADLPLRFSSRGI